MDIRNIGFEFIEEYSVEMNTIETLNTIQQAQLKASFQLSGYQEYASKTFDANNIKDFFNEEKGGFVMACLYHVIDVATDEILYDFWTYNEEDGILFLPNSTTNTGIFMTQFVFEKANNNEFNKDIDDLFIDTLQTAFDNQ